MSKRYLTQMSPDERFSLALYDTEAGRQVAHFTDPALAEQVKTLLNMRGDLLEQHRKRVLRDMEDAHESWRTNDDGA